MVVYTLHIKIELEAIPFLQEDEILIDQRIKHVSCDVSKFSENAEIKSLQQHQQRILIDKIHEFLSANQQ